MLRRPTKLGAALLLAAGLATTRPAPAQTPPNPVIATNVPAPDVRAGMWAATARYVYATDPALAPIRPQLLQTLDSSSRKAFARGLDKAVELEKQADFKQGHILTLQGLYKTIEADEATAAPAALAASIEQALRKKPERTPNGQPTPAFAGLLARLQQLANPASSPVPASLPLPVAGPTPVPAANTMAAPAATSLLPGWLPLALSLLSMALAGFALARSGKPSRRHHGHSHAPAQPALSEQDVRALVRREVEKVLAAQPAAPAAPAQPAPEPVSEPASLVAAPVAAAALPPTPMVRTLYANQQPIDGVFQRSSLAGAPASYTIFELTVDESAPNQARFAVTGNPAGHAGYIGSHQTILGGACTYPFPQGSVSRIVTEVPGTAQRTPGGDWQISQKAQIRFE